MYINLNTHSYFSLLKSTLSVDDIINFAIENKQEYVSLIDINTMYGTIDFYQKAVENNLKPIIGLQINYLNNKTILVAKNNQGYKNLLKISSHIMHDEAFDLSLFLDDLFLIVKDIDEISYSFKKEQAFSYDQTKNNPIAVHECFALNNEETIYLKILHAIANNKLLSELENDNQFDNQYLLTTKEAKEIFSQASLDNLAKLIKQTSWEISFNKEKHFAQYEKNINAFEYLQKWCFLGLSEKLKTRDIPEEYLQRLKYELKIINKKQFNDYFLVVADYVRFAKDNNILVGPGRGSAAGSLVAYALDITGIDPIKNKLIFERFLNPERQTMPDIDLDFIDERRQEIFDYLFKKYTNEKVVHIVTFQRMKIKMAIRDLGRVLGKDMPTVNQVAKALSDYDDAKSFDENLKSNKTFAKMYNLQTTWFNFAKRFLNFPRQTGMHAAGVVISDINLNEIIPTQKFQENYNATQFSMEHLEPLGLIKMDILGLSNLSIINSTIKLIEINRNEKINLNKIPLDDQKVFKQLSDGNTVGIFQLESPGMTKLIKQIQPTSIEDISITSALFRPGPQKNIPTYLENKRNKHNIEYLNKDFREVLSDTYNVIIYQEQVIEIVKRIACFSLAEADNFRRAISKKDAHKLASLKNDFIKGGLINHYTQEELEKIFDYIYEFANYGFNHSHSLAYSYISYWMTYLRTYYSIEFYSSLMTMAAGSSSLINLYINSARKDNLIIKQPNINYSDFNFSFIDQVMYFSFSSIKGLGVEKIKNIINLRDQQKNKVFVGLDQTIHEIVKFCGKKTLELLTKAGALDELLKKENKTRYYVLDNLNSIDGSWAKAMSLEKFSMRLMDEKEHTAQEMSLLDEYQLDLLGFSFVVDPIIEIKNKLNLNDYDTVSELEDDDKEYKIFVYFKKITKLKTKQDKDYLRCDVHDETGKVVLVIYEKTLNSINFEIKEKEYYLVKVKRQYQNVWRAQWIEEFKN